MKVTKYYYQQKRSVGNSIKKTVDLGAGRTSRYGYTGSGRPINEGCEDMDSTGEIINE